MARSDGRGNRDLRPCTIERAYTKFVPGSVLIGMGDTKVLCTASFEEGVPGWRKGSGLGWVTAEYEMLPTAGGRRKNRNRGKVDGRTQEIQRLIGRSMRAVCDLGKLGENSILLDCDVLQADGGTRTAGITGAYVALCDAVRYGLKNKLIAASPVCDTMAAVSAGKVKGRFLLDLNAFEDQQAEVDFNLAMTGSGKIIEVQGTSEAGTMDRQELDRLVALASRGVRDLLAIQDRSLRRRVNTA